MSSDEEEIEERCIAVFRDIASARTIIPIVLANIWFVKDSTSQLASKFSGLSQRH